MAKPTVYQIPICPYCQRIQILAKLKGIEEQLGFHTVDITMPRPDWLLALTRGTTAMPVLALPDGRVIKESLVIVDYLDSAFEGPPVGRRDPWERAVERMLGAIEGDFCAAGYRWILDQDPANRDANRAAVLKQYARLDAFLRQHSPDGTWLFDGFGWAETVFAPFFSRFVFLEYYEGFELPADGEYGRVRRWVEASLEHPAAQQASPEEIVKCYYDYAKGAGNGALLPGRAVSSFSLESDWRARPWPPREKYGPIATDAELGLISSP